MQQSNPNPGGKDSVNGKGQRIVASAAIIEEEVVCVRERVHGLGSLDLSVLCGTLVRR